jgi:tetratricopeptide (TPR) repeat protein
MRIRGATALLPSRIALTLFFAAIVPGVPTTHAQASYQIWQEISHLNDLLNRGEYEHAAKLANLIFERFQVWAPNDQRVAFLAYIGRAQVETGRLGEAAHVLGMAEELSSRIWNNHYEVALFREMAALHYALGEYDATAAAAAKADRFSKERNYPKIRTGYLQSIEALALLRIGKLNDAELLALSAVKNCPKKADKYVVEVPRVLYTACLVESHLGNYADAESYCRRGLEMATSSKRENRDLSLGYLALAEASLQAGDLPRSHEATLKSTDLTRQLFGTEHQDMVSGLGLLAQVIAREGNATDACARAKEAVSIATVLFGKGSPGVAGATSVLLKIEACKP